MIYKKKYQQIFDKIDQKHRQEGIRNIHSHILLVDFINLFIRAYAANPATNNNGIHIGGIAGTLLSLGYAIKKIKPTRVIICSDGKGGSQRRKEIFEDYKANKKKKKYKFNRKFHYDSEDLEEKIMKEQFRRLYQYLSLLPLSFIVEDCVEADDIMAYLTSQFLEREKSKVTIMSTDKDFLQLCNDNINVYSPTKKKIYSSKTVIEEWNVLPQNLVLLRAMEGDRSDNIPGIYGWGKKTILKKINILKNLRIIYTVNDIIEYARNNNIQKILDNENIIRRNYELMQLKDIKISNSIKNSIDNKVFNKKIPNLIKFKIQKMILEDKLFVAIKNSTNWLSDVFDLLSIMAKQFNNNKK